MDKIPKKRSKDYTTAASRLFRDAASMMHGMVLSNAQKPLVSLLDDTSPAQLHKGWEYGYLDGFANQTRTVNRLVWEVNTGLIISLHRLVRLWSHSQVAPTYFVASRSPFIEWGKAGLSGASQQGSCSPTDSQSRKEMDCIAASNFPASCFLMLITEDRLDECGADC